MYTVMRTENRRDSGVLDAATVRQQRRLKQAIRFLHKDSADLLPLDGLKKLGTSNQGQPHHILQKRLLEAKLSRGRLNMTPGEGGGEVLLNISHFDSDEEEGKEEWNLIYIPCKCLGRDVSVLIDTGCRLNLISSLTVDRLGLRGLVEEDKTEVDGFPFQRNLCVNGQVKDLSLTLGRCRVLCSFAVVDSNRPMISLGSRTLMSLKCVVDLEQQMLVFGTTMREQVDFVSKPLRERFL